MSDPIALGMAVTALNVSVASLIYGIVVDRRIERRKRGVARRIPSEAVEAPMREITDAISNAGPRSEDLTDIARKTPFGFSRGRS